ncbi:unnamed protein product [Cercopithifilaria johnstoni]|uniref:Uncharacterized protein n=1 Tax=Cercopithifilaria johnstoni TaxID=2874296 RepID=A0A8J2LR53_9BILA|nr:unnamed protein product [Cercopithifilaria johnstoni]
MRFNLEILSSKLSFPHLLRTEYEIRTSAICKIKSGVTVRSDKRYCLLLLLIMSLFVFCVVCLSDVIFIDFNSQKQQQQKGSPIDESGTRTHASEETGALNQRLRPLGHLAFAYIPHLVQYFDQNGT